MNFGLLGILFAAVIAGAIIGVIALARRARPVGKGDDVSLGADIVTYLLMAVAVLVLVFAVAGLGRAAFPSDPFFFEPERQVASSLAAIAVSAPIAIILWIRQRKRRQQGAGVGGWTLYLTIIELVVTIALVVALGQTLNRLFTGTGNPPWTDVLIYLAAFVFHEFAVRDTPLPRQAHEIPLTVGAAIGFVPLVMGVGGILYEGLLSLYDLMTNTPSFGPGVLESLALLLTGLPVWWYRWLKGWKEGHGPARRAWAIVVSVGSMAAMLGAGVVTLGMTLIFLFGRTDETAGSYFSFLPAALTVAIVAFAAWQHHRAVLGSERSDSVRFYEYLLAAIGVVGIIASFTLLVTVVLSSATFVGDEAEVSIMGAVAGLTALGLWYRYWQRGQKAERTVEAAATPRRLYLLVLGIITAVTSAVALISFLVMVFQAALGVDEGLSDAAIPVAALFVAAGLGAWHLLRTYALDRDLFETGEEIAPFTVTVIASHPGMLASKLPRQAKMRVMYRDDDSGVISDEMADAIVAAVDGRPSMVWVDETGFRVAPLR